MKDEELPKYNITHLVSANRLKVYVRIDILDKDAQIDYTDIMDYLKEQAVSYGIMEDDIKEYCEKKEYSKELVAASGLEPIHGKDAEIIYNFDTSDGNKFLEKEDGTIDFQNLNNIANVKKDDVICYIVPVEDGIDGIDVYSNPIPYKKGRNVQFNNGKNTYITEDGFELRSSVDGCVKKSGNKVMVEDVYKVKDVDNETGNIDFNGSVVINGDVRAGFKVKAKGDIKIRGMVEGAHVESDNDIVISNGVSGMGKGMIIAKGNITSKYIESATVVSEKCVYAETLINSEVTAKESIIMRGNSAAIIGGVSTAGDTISAKTIGNKANSETSLIIDISKYQEEQALMSKKSRHLLEMKRDLNDKTEELKELEEKIGYVLSDSFQNENKKDIHRHLILKKISLNNEINDIKKHLEEEKPSDNIENHKIVCKGIIHNNIRITIGWMRYRVKEDINYSKIYNDGNEIVVVPLNPADID